MRSRRLVALSISVAILAGLIPGSVAPAAAHLDIIDAPQGWFGTLSLDQRFHSHDIDLDTLRETTYDQRGLMTVYLNGHDQAATADVDWVVRQTSSWWVGAIPCSATYTEDFGGPVTPNFDFSLTPPPGEGGTYNLGSSIVQASFVVAWVSDISGPADCGGDSSGSIAGGLNWLPSVGDLPAPDGWDALAGQDCDGDCEPGGPTDNFSYVRTSWSMTMADLVVTKSQASVPPPGADIRLFIDVSNAGPVLPTPFVVSRHIEVTDLIAEGDVMAMDSGDFTCSFGLFGLVLDCDLAELAPRDSKRITLDLVSPRWGLETFACASGFGDRDKWNSCGQLPLANVPPLAADDDVTTSHDRAALVDLFADNGHGIDYDPDAGDRIAVSLVGAPGHGSVNREPGSSLVTYVPEARYVGPDAFPYRISDGNGGFDDATVYVTVVNHPPVAQPTEAV